MDFTEVIHIVISVVTISLAFSMFFLSSLPVVFLTVGCGFILHELAHKFVAIRYGCVARYRAWVEGLVLALVFAVVTQGRFIFAAPGAVYIYKQGLTRRENGIISLAGPLTNFLLGLGFAFLLLVPSPDVQLVGFMGFYVNMFLAFFNLIPVPPLDGSKVISWSVPAWLILFALAGAGVFAKEVFLATFLKLLV